MCLVRTVGFGKDFRERMMIIMSFFQGFFIEFSFEGERCLGVRGRRVVGRLKSLPLLNEP